MDYGVCIQKSIDYIEEHLKEDMGADELARIAGFSAYHYYRIFNVYVGVPVMEYVRRRRLAHAAAELAYGRRIIDIALDYGFETHNGFAKAFRKAYGCSPEKYRLHVSGQAPKKVDLQLFTRYNLKGAIIVEPNFVTKPAFKVAGYELKTTVHDGRNQQEIPAFWGSMTREKLDTLHKKLPAVSPYEMGVCFPIDNATGEFSYVIAVEVYPDAALPDDMFAQEIPAATYAVFTTPPAQTGSQEFVNAIQGTWQYIYETWLPDSGYEFAEGQADYELYSEKAEANGETVGIYIPVVKRQ